MIYIILSLLLFVFIDAKYDAYEYIYRIKHIYVKKFNMFKVLLLISALVTGFLVGQKIFNVGCNEQINYNELVRILISYLFFRFALFNLFFNLTANLRYDYIGTTKFLDKLQRSIAKFLHVNESIFWTFMRIVFLISGIFILI